jgi:hypothetical protein
MQIYDLFNYKIVLETPIGAKTRAPIQGGAKDVSASSFITPQSLAAFPLAAGLVAAFWQAAQSLWVGGKSNWVCFCIAMFVAFLNYVTSISDPRLQASSRQKLVGFLFAFVNGVYLFITALGIKISLVR